MMIVKPEGNKDHYNFDLLLVNLNGIGQHCSESSFRLASEGGPDIGKAIYPSPTLPTFAFKIRDQKGRMHRFISGMFLYNIF